MPNSPNRFRAALPVAFHAGCVFLVIATAIYFYNQPRNPEAVAAEVQPLVAAQWQAYPVMMFARVEGVTLEHKAGGEYTGHVQYKLATYQTRVAITVQADRSPLEWQLDAGASGMPLSMEWFDSHQVFAEYPVTMAEAKAYADWTVPEHRLGAAPGSTVLSKVGQVVIVRIGLQAHALADLEAGRELDAKTDKLFHAIAEGLSEHVFRGPVDVHLCDDELATKKVIAWR